MSDLPQRKGRPAYMQPHQFGDGEQLKMFMTRGEIAKDYAPIDHNIGTTAEFWAGKAREARSHKAARGLIDGAGVWDSVREIGVQTPVHLAESETKHNNNQGKAIVGGHHRIISARKNDLIPVMHHTSFSAAQYDTGWKNAYEREYT